MGSRRDAGSTEPTQGTRPQTRQCPGAQASRWPDADRRKCRRTSPIFHDYSNGKLGNPFTGRGAVVAFCAHQVRALCRRTCHAGAETPLQKLYLTRPSQATSQDQPKIGCGSRRQMARCDTVNLSQARTVGGSRALGPPAGPRSPPPPVGRRGSNLMALSKMDVRCRQRK